MLNEQTLKRFISTIFKSDESRFHLSTALKITTIPILSSAFIAFIIWLFINIDLLFFEANGFMKIEELRDVYYDFVFSQVSYMLIYFFIFCVALFFVGNYIAALMIRPFKIMGEYCEDMLNKKNSSYNPDLFSDLKLFTRFSEFFFLHIENIKKNKQLIVSEIPPHFTKIHKPVFEKVFFFHFFLFLSIICIISSIATTVLMSEIHAQIITLSVETLKADHSISYFLKEQSTLIKSVISTSIFVESCLFFAMAVHLHNAVSGAAFGIFSTMRAFAKGNFSARVHLIGYYYLRPYCRSLNKYLDHIQRTFDN